MKRKVKIVKVPEYKYGGGHTGDQQNYGLYRGGGNLQDYLTGSELPNQQDIRVTYPEVPRDEATIEVEKGEYIIPSDMSALYKVGGKKHSQGGTPVYAQGGEYVVSDYITMSPALQEIFGFEAKSKRKKDNTIAKLLGDKVDAKDYNRLSKLIMDDANNKPVDRFELATAKYRMPKYQEYISNAALGGELSKAFQGKDFEIPEIGMPALEKLQSESRRDSTEMEPLAQAKMGGKLKVVKKNDLEKYQFRPGTIPSSWIRQVPIDSTGYRSTGTGYISPITVTADTLPLPPVQTIPVVQSVPAVQQRVDGAGMPIPEDGLIPEFVELTDEQKRLRFEARRLLAANLRKQAQKEEQKAMEEVGLTPSSTQTVTQGQTQTTSSTGTSQTTETPKLKVTGKDESGGDKDKTGADKNGNLNFIKAANVAMRPWTQNLIQTGLLAADLFNKENIYPWEPAINYTYPTAVFRSPRQAIAAIQSQAADAMRNAAMFAGPQRFASIASNIQAQTIPGIVQAEEQVNAANQMIANQLGPTVAQIVNQLAGARAESALRVKDKTTLTRAQSRREDTGKLAALVQSGILPTINEAQRTAWRNIISNYYDINPITGQFEFTGGKGLRGTTEASRLESDVATIQRLKGLGLNASEAIDYIIALRRGTGRMPTGRNASTDDLFTLMQAQGLL